MENFNRRLKVFISYSHKDADTAAKVVDALEKEQSISVWIDVHKLDVGDRLWDAILSEIPRAFYMVLLLSNSSVASDAVRRELKEGLKQHRQARDINFLLPLKIDDVDVPEYLQEILYSDASSSLNEGIRKIIDRIRHDKIVRKLSSGMQPFFYAPSGIPDSPANLECPSCGAGGEFIYFEEQGGTQTHEPLCYKFCFVCGFEDDDFARYFGEPKRTGLRI